MRMIEPERFFGLFKDALLKSGIKAKPADQQLATEFSNKDRKTYDIKDSKVDRADKQETSFVFLIKPSRKYFVLTPQEVKEFGVLKPNPLWGGKPCYNIPKAKLTMRSIDDPLILDDFF